MLVTVFTPTYNRASTLPRLYNALKRQTDRRFEWLIVDDGSTDDTSSLVQQYQKEENDFQIRFYRQNHGGKPRAQNWAIDLATGELFITCDSNKYPDVKAVEHILSMAETIKGIPMMCGVGGYRADLTGKVLGGQMEIEPGCYVDCTRLEGEKCGITGDKASAFFTEILQQYKSPEYPGELFISEGVWLIPMAMDGYKTRWFPEILIYGEYSKDGLTVQGANSRSGHETNFLGFLHLLNVEIAAKGYKAMEYLIYEALEIAKDKGMSSTELANRLGCTDFTIFLLRINKSIHRYYGIVSRKVKRIIGPKTVDIVRKALGR